MLEYHYLHKKYIIYLQKSNNYKETYWNNISIFLKIKINGIIFKHNGTLNNKGHIIFEKEEDAINFINEATSLSIINKLTKVD